MIIANRARFGPFRLKFSPGQDKSDLFPFLANYCLDMEREIISAPDLHLWIDSAAADRYRGSWVATNEYGDVLRQENSQELLEDQPGVWWLIFIPDSGSGVVVPSETVE